MANNYHATGRCSNLPKGTIVKRKRKIQKLKNEQDEAKGSDDYTIPRWSHLPDELLDIISKKIDFVSFFALGGVCKNWRNFYENYWGDFMASQAPLVILKSTYAKKACSFFSISEGKGYKTWLPYHWGEMESSSGFWKSFVGFSSGYLIRQSSVSSAKLWLINPFTRKELHIPESHCPSNLVVPSFVHALLAFVVNSEDFVVLGMVSYSSNFFFIYQSRKSSWEVYSIKETWWVKDVAVFQNTIYVLTSGGSIEVVRLNSPNCKVLKLNNVPVHCFFDSKLLSSNDELLVVDFIHEEELRIYRIDLSKMEWVRVHSLGDRALFVGRFMQCYALNHPSLWGYETNCVYNISHPVCHLHYMNNIELVRTVRHFKQYPKAWCFPSVRDEIDYSLHDKGTTSSSRLNK